MTVDALPYAQTMFILHDMLHPMCPKKVLDVYQTLSYLSVGSGNASMHACMSVIPCAKSNLNMHGDLTIALNVLGTQHLAVLHASKRVNTKISN